MNVPITRENVRDIPVVGSIKRAFPFFKDLKLHAREILFVYRYVNNNFNAQEAYTFAGLGGTKKTIEVNSCQYLKRPRVQEGMKKYLEDILGDERNELEKKLFDIFFVQAFYDPSMFYNLNGTPKFKKWADIPEKYRCCVESLETKMYGKDARSIVVLKLIDRKWAQDKLDKYIGMTKEKIDVKHTFQMTQETENNLRSTFDGDGKKK